MSPNRRATDNYEPKTIFEAVLLEKITNLDVKTDDMHKAIFDKDGLLGKDGVLFGAVGFQQQIRKIENKQYWLSGVAAALSAAATWFTTKH